MWVACARCRCQCREINLGPRILSYLPYGARERETLENAGHVSPRIWEITNKRFGGVAGKCEICLYRAYTVSWLHWPVYWTWSWTPKIMHKILWQQKCNFLQNIWMLIGCLSAMLSFGTCNGNRGGLSVCAVKNNLGILVVVFIPKRIRFELLFLCCGGHFRKQIQYLYVFSRLLLCRLCCLSISCCLPCRIGI